MLTWIYTICLLTWICPSCVLGSDAKSHINALNTAIEKAYAAIEKYTQYQLNIEKEPPSTSQSELKKDIIEALPKHIHMHATTMDNIDHPVATLIRKAFTPKYTPGKNLNLYYNTYTKEACIFTQSILQDFHKNAPWLFKPETSLYLADSIYKNFSTIHAFLRNANNSTLTEYVTPLWNTITHFTSPKTWYTRLSKDPTPTSLFEAWLQAFNNDMDIDRLSKQ